MPELTFNANRGPTPRDTEKKKKRCGLMKACIGTNHILKCSDGRNRSFLVRDYRDFPKAQTVAVCLKCGKSWPSAEAMIAAHPDHNTMVKQEEAHVIVLWCEEALKPENLEVDDKGKPKGKVPYDNMIGFLSDEHPHQE